MRSFQDKAVWVSGVSRGIGSELVKVLSARGARVYGCARTTPDVSLLTRSFACDITSESDVQAMFATLCELEPDGLAMLVHNAAILGPRGRLVDIDAGEWRNVVDVNLNGSFLVAKYGLAAIARDGVFMGLSSSVGRGGRAEWGPYSASKNGLEGLLDIIAGEYPELTVLSVNPGGTATDMRADAFPEEEPNTLPTAQAVAEAIARMSEDDALRSVARLNVRDALG